MTSEELFINALELEIRKILREEHGFSDDKIEEVLAMMREQGLIKGRADLIHSILDTEIDPEMPN